MSNSRRPSRSPRAPSTARRPCTQETPEPLDARQLARQALQAQMEIAQRCERQFTEACRDLRRTNDKVMTDPAQANADAQQLAKALLDKMLVEGEPCLRVLGEMSGDRHAAHSLNVAVVSLMLGRQLAIPSSVLMELGVGALMHDVGKIALPDRVRLARDDFNAGEAALYRDHVAQGLILGRRMGLSADAQLVIAQHHELADGSGFPSALMLPRMSLPARIVALVNRYDNLCNAASPGQSITPHEALSRLFAQCRSKFDETLLSGFIKMMGIYPPGSCVQLSDEPLRHGDDRQRGASAQAARAGLRPGHARRGGDPPRSREDAATGHPAQPEAGATADARPRLSQAASAHLVLLRCRERAARGCARRGAVMSAARPPEGARAAARRAEALS